MSVIVISETMAGLRLGLKMLPAATASDERMIVRLFGDLKILCEVGVGVDALVLDVS